MRTSFPAFAAAVPVLVCWAVAPTVMAEEPAAQSPVFYIQEEGGGGFRARAGRMQALFTSGGVAIRAPEGELRVSFPGSAPDRALEAEKPTGATVNFLTGDDPDAWRTEVPVYGQVRYRGLYEGVDLLYGSAGRFLKSEFVVAPDHDASAIRVRYEGAEGVEIASDGSVVVRLGNGELREERPVAYQNTPGGTRQVEVRFELAGDNTVRFALGEHDPSLPLVIDPTLSFSAYVGGSGIDSANAIAVDAAGDVFVCGQSESAGLSTSGVAQPGFRGSVDAWVAKFNGTTGALLFVTYLGGSFQDFANGIAVAADGSPIVVGYTYSGNFPTRSAFQTSIRGDKEAFVSKLNPSGTALTFSTFLGGSGADIANAVAVDRSGNIDVAGETRSWNFPLRYTLQPSLKGSMDAFVVQFSAAGVLGFSTYLGGSGEDRALSVTTDGASAIVVGGGTGSVDFPIRNAAQTKLKGSEDAFLARLTTSGGILWSTFLGGSSGASTNPERVFGVAADAAGNIFAAGVTPSWDFPVLLPYQPALSGGQDAFLVKFGTSGTQLFGTFFGGMTSDVGYAVAVDADGAAYLAGKTDSANLPLQDAVQAQKAGAMEAFVARFSGDGSQLLLGTYLGGSGGESAKGVAAPNSSTVWVAGQTQSANFPIVGGSRPFGSAEGEAFIAKLSLGGLPVSAAVTPTAGSGSEGTFTFTYTDARGAANLAYAYGWFDSRPAVASSCLWRYDRAAHQIALLSDGGTTYLAGAAPGAPTTLSNSQCSIDLGTAAATVSGTELQVLVKVTFEASFGGTKNVYAYATDSTGQTSDNSQVKGSWSVPVAAQQTPTLVMVSPSSGTGASGTFAYVVADANGANDIQLIYGLFDTAYQTASTCHWRFEVPTRRLSLINDAGTGYLGPITPGGSTDVSNSRCTLGAGFTANMGGEGLTLMIPVAFASGFTGTKNLFLAAEDAARSTGYVVMGSWTIPTGGGGGTTPPPQPPTVPEAPPRIVSVTPSSGSGPGARFTYVISDVNGSSDLRYLYGYYDSIYRTAGTCFWRYDPTQQKLWLVNDTGNGYLGPMVLGGSQSISNSQCSLQADFSATTTSTDLTLSISVDFAAGFAGARKINISAEDMSSSTGYVTMGTWTVTAP